MKRVLLPLFLVVCVLADTEMYNLWSSWKLRYSKQYEDEATDAHRFSIFLSNYKRIVTWNAAGNTAVLALNKFADLTNEEFAALYTGAIPEPQEKVLTSLETPEVKDLPDSWDWRTQGAVNPIGDQQGCGACWAFSAVSAIEGLYKINTGKLVSFSVQQLVDCDTQDHGCAGGHPSVAFLYVAGNGLQTEATYPYTARTESCRYDQSLAIKTGVTGSAFVYALNNSTQLKTAIVNQPVSVLVEGDQDVFQFYAGGVISNNCGPLLNHAVTAIGYGIFNGEDSFIVRNSWGTDWGLQGYAYISTTTQVNNGFGPCGILLQPQYPKGLNK